MSTGWQSMRRVSPAMLVVLGYAAIFLIIMLQEQWQPTYAPPNLFWVCVMYAVGCIGFLCFILGFILSVLYIVRWRRVGESLIALVLLVPMGLIIHSSVMRARAVKAAQQSVAADSRENSAPPPYGSPTQSGRYL